MSAVAAMAVMPDEKYEQVCQAIRDFVFDYVEYNTNDKGGDCFWMLTERCTLSPDAYEVVYLDDISAPASDYHYLDGVSFNNDSMEIEIGWHCDEYASLTEAERESWRARAKHDSFEYIPDDNGCVHDNPNGSISLFAKTWEAYCQWHIQRHKQVEYRVFRNKFHANEDPAPTPLLYTQRAKWVIECMRDLLEDAVVEIKCGFENHDVKSACFSLKEFVDMEPLKGRYLG